MVQRAFSSFFIFMLVAGILISITGIIFAEPLFRLSNTPEEIIPAAVSYFQIYIGGTFLFVTFNSIISILRGMGESVKPMVFILISTLLNISLDLLFILLFGWGIEGAARATVVAQGFGMCLALWYVRDKHPLPQSAFTGATVAQNGCPFRYGLRWGCCSLRVWGGARPSLCCRCP